MISFTREACWTADFRSNEMETSHPNLCQLVRPCYTWVRVKCQLREWDWTEYTTALFNEIKRQQHLRCRKKISSWRDWVQQSFLLQWLETPPISFSIKKLHSFPVIYQILPHPNCTNFLFLSHGVANSLLSWSLFKCLTSTLIIFQLKGPRLKSGCSRYDWAVPPFSIS